MRSLKKKIYFFVLLIFINNIFYTYSESEINNKILVKVGNEIITSHDLQNEIITNLIISKKEVNQDNINLVKDLSVKNLINKKIKKIEIKKYEVKDYSKKELNDYLTKIASERFNTNIAGLKNIFNENAISFDAFSEAFETELLWNTLIFSLYKNQTNINIVQVENELSKFKEIKNTEEIAKLKQEMLNQRKQEKLNLFSRSHFSNLENTIQIQFL